MCCMLSTIHVSSLTVANISESSLLSLDSSLGLTGRKHYLKITIPIFRLILQNFAFPGCFSYILLDRYRFSLLSSGWVVIAVCDYFSPGNYLNIRGFVNWCRVAISNDESTSWVPSLFIPPPLGAGGIMFSGCPSVQSLKYPLSACRHRHRHRQYLFNIQ